MLFHTGKKMEINLFLDGFKLEQLGSKCNNKYATFLGIRIDDNLSWDFQIDHVEKKLRKIIYVLNQVKSTLPLKLKILLFKGLLQPHIEYGISIWGNSKHLNRIIKLQKWGLRTIYKCKPFSHTSNLSHLARSRSL